MSDWFQDVLEFHKAMGHYIGNTPQFPDFLVIELRHALEQEEFSELCSAVINRDIVGVADGIADLIYVLIGRAISFGIDLRPVFAAVHKANMAKVDGPIRADGKKLKPEGWKPPDIAGILAKQEPLV